MSKHPKITELNPTTIRALRDQLNRALALFGKANGLDIEVGNASYSDSQVVFRLTCSLDGVDIQREAFERDAPRFGMPAGAYGMQFRYAGCVYILRGLKPRRPKFPVLAERDGRLYKLPRNAIEVARQAYVTEGGA